jgi:RNA polymerase sigma factor (TIGR02999 family)
MGKMQPAASPKHISTLMAAFRQGDKHAANDLIEIFYPQLRRLASRQMSGERAGHSWQPTLLVNELYLELLKIKALPSPADGGADEKAAFFGLAAHLMRRLLIHHARPLRAKAVNVPLEKAEELAAASIDEVETMLAKLARIRPRLRSIVELKVFEGMTIDEIAARLDCSTATVIREWSFAKHFLETELADSAAT